MKGFSYLLMLIIVISCALLVTGRCQLPAGTLATGSALLLGKLE